MNNKYVCNFAVVRFLPYPETDEFVNIGVVMACPQTGCFDYMIETKRRNRITDFFPELDKELLINGRIDFERELARAKAMLNKDAKPDQRKFAFDEKTFVAVFRELVRPRESVFRFGGIGTVMTDKPAEKLKDLFEYYVRRQFAQREEYHETVMARRLKRVLKVDQIIDKYHEVRLGNDLYHVTMPLVHEDGNRPVSAINPLDLDKHDSTRIIEYGDKWQRRIQRLKEMQCFPKNMLFVVHEPAKGRKRDAANEVRSELAALDVETLNEHEKDAVIEFARAS